MCLIFFTKTGTSWRRIGPEAEGVFAETVPEPKDIRSEQNISHTTGSLLIDAQPSNWLNLLVGGSVDRQFLEDLPATQAAIVETWTIAAYAQTIVNVVDLFKLTAGIRGEHNYDYGSSFGLRFAITKAYDKFHYKLMYSNGVKTPSLYDIRNDRDTTTANILTRDSPSKLKPERSEVIEAEVGYMLTKDLFVSGNVFNNKISDFVSWYSSGDQFATGNFGEVETRGVEASAKYQRPWGFANFSYSYYRTVKNTTDYTSVPGHPEVNLGIPAHKLTLNTRYRVGRFTANPSFLFMTSRYGYAEAAETKEEALKEYKSVFLINFYASYDIPFVQGLRIGAGVYDLLNHKPVIIQPFFGEHSPIPGPSREFLGKITYDVNL